MGGREWGESGERGERYSEESGSSREGELSRNQSRFETRQRPFVEVMEVEKWTLR